MVIAVENEMIVEEIKQKKDLIFTVTPGRSGTSYLAKLLEAVPGVDAHHEPSPHFGQVLRLIQVQPMVAIKYLTLYKLPAILKSPNRIYAETSHMTCKGFLEPMITLGLRPSLIILRRHPREVAWSFLERKSVPGRTTDGLYYLLEPRDIGVTPFLNWETATNYQMCFWYALEIERRQIHYSSLAQQLGMTIVDITHKQLNYWECYSQMLNTLGLPVSEQVRGSHAAISDVIHNQNPQQLAFSDSLVEEEEVVWNSVGYFNPLLRAHIERRYG